MRYSKIFKALCVLCVLAGAVPGAQATLLASQFVGYVQPLAYDFTTGIGCDPSVCCCIGPDPLSIQLIDNGAQMQLTGSMSGQCVDLTTTRPPACSTNAACASSGQITVIGSTTYCCPGGQTLVLNGPYGTCACGNAVTTSTPHASRTFDMTIFTPPILSGTPGDYFDSIIWPGSPEYQFQMDANMNLIINTLTNGTPMPRCNAHWGASWLTHCTKPLDYCGPNGVYTCPVPASDPVCNCVNGAYGTRCEMGGPVAPPPSPPAPSSTASHQSPGAHGASSSSAAAAGQGGAGAAGAPSTPGAPAPVHSAAAPVAAFSLCVLAGAALTLMTLLLF